MKKIGFWKFFLPLGLGLFLAGAFLAPGSNGELTQTHRTALIVFLLSGVTLILLAFKDLKTIKVTKNSNQAKIIQN